MRAEGEEKRKIVYIMRGISGSGKSTVAREIAAREIAGTEGVIHSTDSYFVSEAGEYKFDPMTIGEKHRLNMADFEKSLLDGKTLVIVDNTNITRRDYEPYVELARKHGYEVRFKEMPIIGIGEALARNTHNVPREKIELQKSRWEESETG